MSVNINHQTNNVQVGAALTLGHTQGLQYHTQSLHTDGFEVNNINASGIVTAGIVSTTTIEVSGISTFRDQISIVRPNNSIYSYKFLEFIAGIGITDRVGGLSIYNNTLTLWAQDCDLNLAGDSPHDTVITTNGVNGSYTGSVGRTAVFTANGSAQLWYQDVKKFETTGGGVIVTGTNTADAFAGFDYLKAPHGTTVNYAVTVASKTAAHRYNGTGSGSGYVIDGVEAPFLTLTPGRTYRFTLSSSDMTSHPFRFYLEADRTTQYTTNVTSTSTYTQIVVTDTTPTVLHYQCSAHGYMGNAVQVNSNTINTPYEIVGLDGANITGIVTATGFSTTTGTSSQFLKADGSVDSNTYLATESDPVVGAISGIVKADGGGNISAATAGTDYLTPSGDGSSLTGLTGASAATYGSAAATPVIVVDSNGRITGISTVATSGGGGTVSEAFKTISVSGQSDVVADGATDTLTFVAGSNMTITTNASGDSITFASSGGGGGGTTTRSVNRYVATANQTLFPASGTISYTVGYVDVFINGTKLDSTEFTASNGTTVTLATGATVDDIVELVAYTNVNITSVYNPWVNDAVGINTTSSVGIGTTANSTYELDVLGDIRSTGIITAANFYGDGSNLTGVSSEAFKTISVSGQSDVVADGVADTLTLVAGSNMTITTNASGDSITFASSGGGNFNELDAMLFS